MRHDASRSLLRPVVIAGTTAIASAILLVVQWRLSIDGDIGIGVVQQRRVIDRPGILLTGAAPGS